jgi:hypothetical protein
MRKFSDFGDTVVQTVRWFLVLAASFKAIREHEAARD